VEASLGKKSPWTETPLYRVLMATQQELSPEELLLYKSAESAQREGRFHSLEEHAVMQKFQELQLVVARRLGYPSFGAVNCEYWRSQPKPSAEDFKKIVAALHWGRDNCAHLRRLELAREASQANCSASGIVPDQSSGTAT
jgi:hypothetical protein